ncbi:hypothetical protein YC2023_071012 [Brassica napus]
METTITGGIRTVYGLSLRGAATELFTCVETMVEIQKKEFVTNGAIPLQVKRSSVCCRKMDSLIFLAPASCSRKLDKSQTSLRYNNIHLLTNKSNLAHRLRVELAGDDGEDGDITIAAVINGQSLDELTGKQYLFQIRLTPYNFTPNHLTFTVFAITEDVAVKTHSRVKASTSPTSGRPE